MAGLSDRFYRSTGSWQVRCERGGSRTWKGAFVGSLPYLLGQQHIYHLKITWNRAMINGALRWPLASLASLRDASHSCRSWYEEPFDACQREEKQGSRQGPLSSMVTGTWWSLSLEIWLWYEALRGSFLVTSPGLFMVVSCYHPFSFRGLWRLWSST